MKMGERKAVNKNNEWKQKRKARESELERARAKTEEIVWVKENYWFATELLPFHEH